MDTNQTLRDMVVVIGAMKCGTSSLHSYLDLHPEVQMSRLKELDFFVSTKRLGRGLDWYRAQFSPSARRRGESSPNYTKYPTFPGVPERMSQVMPDARLIYIVRDPVDRVVSHYVHNLSHGREARPISEALAHPETNDYVYPSRYHFQLQRFLACFDASQFLILDQRALKDDRHPTLRRVFRFLGVDPDFQHPGFDREHHSSSRKGQPTPLARSLMRYPGGRAARYALPWVFERPLERPHLPDDTRRALEAVLAPDAEALRAFSGEAFSHWSV